MTREERAREVLFAKQVEANWMRDGWDEPAVHGDELVAAILAFADAEIERAAQVAERCGLHDGDYLKNSDPRVTIATAIRDLKGQP